MSTVRIEPIKRHIGGIVHVAKDHLLEARPSPPCARRWRIVGFSSSLALDLTDAEQLAFTDKLGTRLNYTRKAPGSDAADEKDVYAITLDKKINNQPEYVLGTFFWHIDGVNIDQPLPKATLLSARKLSPTGGQTEFASTYAAYESLPEMEKKAHREAQGRAQDGGQHASGIRGIVPRRILLAGAACRRSWPIRSSGSTARAASRW